MNVRYQLESSSQAAGGLFSQLFSVPSPPKRMRLKLTLTALGFLPLSLNARGALASFFFSFYTAC